MSAIPTATDVFLRNITSSTISVVIFEQNILRTLKGLSPACESYAKLLLHGMSHFLEQLRGLKTATEQATQTSTYMARSCNPECSNHISVWFVGCPTAITSWIPTTTGSEREHRCEGEQLVRSLQSSNLCYTVAHATLTRSHRIVNDSPETWKKNPDGSTKRFC